MRTSRKKLLRLDEKTCYRDELDCGEEDDDYRSDYRRKLRYKQSSEEVFKCKHCRRFVCAPYSGGRHRNHCPFCTLSDISFASSCVSLISGSNAFMMPGGAIATVMRCFTPAG